MMPGLRPAFIYCLLLTSALGHTSGWNIQGAGQPNCCPFLCAANLHLADAESRSGKGAIHVEVIGHHVYVVEDVAGTSCNG